MEGSFKLPWKIKVLLLFFCMIFPASLLFANIYPEDSHFINPMYSKKISLDFKNASLSEVLKVFSKQANMNFIAKTDISALRVTLYLEGVPVEEALNYVLSTNDLEYTALPAENTFFVTKKTDKNTQLVTKVFKLKYASVSNSALKNTFDSESASTGGSSSGPSTFASASSLGGLVDAVKMVLSRNGILVEDARTNSLIITDVASQMPVIEKTINSLDVTVSQILIEVDMLDISKSTSDLMGAKWGDTIFNFQGSSKNSILPFDQTSALADGKTTLITESDSESSSTSTSPYTAGKLDFTSMNVVVNFLRTRSDTKNLARPRILTLNNQMAQIHVSTDEAVGTKTSNFASSSTTSSVEAERTKTGVFLTVTPQADLETREILMAVYPKVIQSRTGATFGSSTFKDAEERGTKSFLRVKDGQTIIIGGLLRNDDTNTITKVPFLGDIPFLGAAFKHKNGAGTRRELIIFLTPHILDDKYPYDAQFREKNAYFRWDEINKAIDDLDQEE